MGKFIRPLPVTLRAQCQHREAGANIQQFGIESQCQTLDKAGFNGQMRPFLERSSKQLLTATAAPEGGEGARPNMGPAQLLQKYLQSLQRLQERNQLVLLRGAQSTVVVDDRRGFSGMPQNRIVPGE